jgi:septum formation protein
MPPTTPSMPAQIYLASQSPRRRELLALWGVEASLLLPEPSEDAEALETVRPGERPLRYVKRVTQAKLTAAAQRLARLGGPKLPILCADTTVALGDLILGKPASPDDARRLLALLSGQTHRVFTAVSVGYWDGTNQWLSGQLVSQSQVTFAALSATQVNAYVDSQEPMGKAGAYAVQGLGGLFITNIKGSYSGIMGLPAYETGQLLVQAGVSLAVAT